MLQDYLWLLFTIGFASIMQGIKLCDTNNYKTKGELIRKVIYGMGGSGITVICVYHICIYFNLNDNLSLALGGACGYIGADYFIKFLERFLEKKINS